MFEKEAEIYALSNYGFRGKNSQRVFTAKIDYQKGAKFGYNKANEWHYVKDGDYPTDEKKVLCILGDFENDNLEVGYYFQGKQKDNRRWCFENYNLPDNNEEEWGVSAWKEIVLPKEIE